MTFSESLTTKEAKAKWIEMVKKYHPDNKETGSHDKMIKVNDAEEKGDDAVNKLYDDLIGKKVYNDGIWKNSGQEQARQTHRDTSNKNDSKNSLEKRMNQVKQWLLQPDFTALFNRNHIVYKLYRVGNNVFIDLKRVIKGKSEFILSKEINNWNYQSQDSLYYYLKSKIGDKS